MLTDATAVETASAASSGVSTADSGGGTRGQDADFGLADTAEPGPVVVDLDAAQGGAHEATTDAAKTETTQATDGTDSQQQADEAVAVGAMPPDVQAVFASPARATPEQLQKARSWAQSASDQLGQYRSLGPVREVRAFAEAFPGGVKEAVAYRDKALTLDQTDNVYESGDPAAMAQTAATWLEQSPENYPVLLQAAAGVLRDRNPEAFAEFTGGLLKDAFAGNKWDVQLASLEQLLEQVPDDVWQGRDALGSLVRQVKWLTNDANRAGIRYQEKGRTRPEDEALRRQGESIKTQKEQLQVERQNFFRAQVGNDVVSDVRRSIDGTLANLLKDTAFTANGKKAIAEDIFNGVDARLRQDRTFQATVERMHREAAWDANKRGNLVQFMVGRAKALMAGVAKQVVEEHGKRVQVATTEANKKKEAAGDRANITGGQAATVRPRRFTQAELQGLSGADREAIVDRQMGL